MEMRIQGLGVWKGANPARVRSRPDAYGVHVDENHTGGTGAWVGAGLGIVRGIECPVACVQCKRYLLPVHTTSTKRYSVHVGSRYYYT